MSREEETAAELFELIRVSERMAGMVPLVAAISQSLELVAELPGAQAIFPELGALHSDLVSICDRMEAVMAVLSAKASIALDDDQA